MCACLRTEDELQIVAESDTATDYVALCALHMPDVVLLGHAGQSDVVGVVKDVLQACSNSQLLVLSATGGDALVRKVMAVGAKGFILQDSSPRELATAIRVVARGMRYLDCTTAMEITLRCADEDLRVKEVEILSRVAAGMGNKQIAVELSTTEGTVKNHVKRILAKLDARDRTHAVMIAMRRGFLTMIH